MPVVFTKHALQQAAVRGITRDEIITTIETPDDIKQDDAGNTIAQKMVSAYFLRVVYHFEGSNTIVITAYKTSKVEKYV
jgi:hypothetical protein